MVKSALVAHEKKVALYERSLETIDTQTGEILYSESTTVNKVSAEPEFIKLYYETMLAFNQIKNVPINFVLSISKFIEWSNEGSPLCVTLNKRVKQIIMNDCNVSLPQVDRYIKLSVESGLLFRTEFRSVYEVNPFMIAKGKWDSIKQLRGNFDFVNGKWERTVVSSGEEFGNE